MYPAIEYVCMVPRVPKGSAEGKVAMMATAMVDSLRGERSGWLGVGREWYLHCNFQFWGV